MENENQNTDMFKNFEKAIEMVQLFNMMNDTNQMDQEAQPQKRQEEPVRPYVAAKASAPGYYDDLIYSPELKGIKAAIPYLDEKYQRNIGIFVKLIEMQKLLESYSRRVIDMHAHQESDWRRGMLNAVRAHMPTEKQKRIDILLNVLNMQEMMIKMKEEKL